MADSNNMPVAALVLIVLFSIMPNVKESKNYLKSIDKNMHTHAADDIQGIGGWY